MNIKHFFINSLIALCTLHTAHSYELFHADEPIQNGIPVFESSDVFAEIYEKLNDISWGGKNINIAVESLEKLHPNAHVAATDERVVLVWRDDIIANFPRPNAGDWDGFGQITTALALKLREQIPEFAKRSVSGMFEDVVGALISGIDENGRYVYDTQAEVFEDGRILTSVGLEGGREQGYFRVTGVIKDSPADTAGIRAGDIISAINGVFVPRMADDEIWPAFSGFNSGTLKLEVVSDNSPRNVVLRRATIVLADADIVKRANILEIIIHKISDNSVAIVNEALAKNPDTDGIILDLRSARGDDERAAAKLAGLFLGRVPVMRIIETAKNEVEVIPGGNAVTDADMVILISNTTVGTAESVAAAFYENHRGILVGTPSAGAARIATKINLSNGGALEILNKSIKTGQGNLIDDRGVFPLVCLSNIRTDEQQGAFFLNVINGDFYARDFNTEPDMDSATIRKGCPTITSGADEDLISAAVAVKILTDGKVYSRLINL